MSDGFSNSSIWKSDRQLLIRFVLTRYENTEKRAARVAEKGLGYLGMGVSGGEEGARNGVQHKLLCCLACLTSKFVGRATSTPVKRKI